MGGRGEACARAPSPPPGPARLLLGCLLTALLEFGPTKSASNLEKHRIDFTAVQALWEDSMRVEIPARTVDEPRWLVIGQIEGRHWPVVVTYREDRARIISARRSRKEEAALYEG